VGQLAVNRVVAARLEEVATLLHEQEANPFRVAAWRAGAETIRRLPRPVDAVLAEGGIEALEALPGIGEGLAGAIEALVRTGRLPVLERLRGEGDPAALIASVAGIGDVLAQRVHDRLGIESLAELEAAAHDGRLATVRGMGPTRISAIRDALAVRLAHVRPARPAGPEPEVGDLLDVDDEYRREGAAGKLKLIAPRRFNPTGEAWLPVMHTVRGERHYTALFSNTAQAHRLGRTRDWVVIYLEGAGAERQWTVVTARTGPLNGRRVVRGREPECVEHYGLSRTS
jgi:hypothetical protein